MEEFLHLVSPRKIFIICLILVLFSFVFVSEAKAQGCCDTSIQCNQWGCIHCLGSQCEQWCGCNGDVTCGWECFDDCCGGGGCFPREVEIKTGLSNDQGKRTEDQENSQTTKKISDLKLGEVVEQFDPETGEVSEGTVSDVTKTAREGYYILETESGKNVKVTGEHPFLAIKRAEGEERSGEKLVDKLKNVFSHTLTYRVITGLQAKIGEVLK